MLRAPTRFSLSWIRNNLSKAILIGIAIVIAVMTLVFIQSLRAERDLRTHSLLNTELVGRLHELLLAGTNAETGQRGFLLTGKTDFLQPYDEAQGSWLTQIDAMRGDLKSAGAADEIPDIIRLRREAAAKLEELKRTIALSRAGQHELAVEIVKKDGGKILMDRIRVTISGLVERRMDALANVEPQLKQIRLVRAVSVAFLVAAIMALGYFSIVQSRTAERAAFLDREAVLLREGKEQADLIAQELNHRVKNLFAVILSLVGLSARGGTDVPTTVEKIRNRIFALSTAHSISQGKSDIQRFELKELLRTILAPYNHSDTLISIEGPEAELSSEAITPLGLIFHEVATNALKYGALSAPGGSVDVQWTVESQQLELVWAERGGPVAKPGKSDGFGSTLIAATAEQLGGTIENIWADKGLTMILRFPVD